MPTFQGKTMQAAIELGLQVMQVPRDAVTIEVVDEGKRGFLGFGRRLATVELTPKVVAPEATAPDEAQTAPETAEKPDDATALQLVETYLQSVTKAMAIDATVSQSRQSNVVTFTFATDKEALLIGKHGRIINALQELAQTLFNHHGQHKLTLMLDVGDYRERRQDTVKRLAQRSARDVIATGQPVYLDPMPSFERKAIHAALADNPYVHTRSDGHDPYRYVVIVPQKQH